MLVLQTTSAFRLMCTSELSSPKLLIDFLRVSKLYRI